MEGEGERVREREGGKEGGFSRQCIERILRRLLCRARLIPPARPYDLTRRPKVIEAARDRVVGLTHGLQGRHVAVDGHRTCRRVSLNCGGYHLLSQL